MPDPALYRPLFQPFAAGGLELSNRVVMAPMTRRKCPRPNVPGDEIASYYARRASCGLIITEGVHIDNRNAWDTDDVPGLHTAAQADGWAEVVEAVHEAGGKIAAQLWHTGRHAAEPIGPSAIPVVRGDGTPKATPRAMTLTDLAQVRDAFCRSATLAQRAGFDAIELHGAHGYLLDSFVSGVANQREDDYGGTFANRMRFPLEVVSAVREAVGDGYPIIYRFSQWKVENYDALNYPNPDALGAWVTALREAGADILHASTRDATEAAFPPDQTTLAGWTRRLSDLPVIAVGRVATSASMGEPGDVRTTDPASAAALVANGEADLIGVGRSLIANPDWCAIVERGDWHALAPYRVEMLETLA
ncbi:12-oxophytodienoate reductase [Pyruvatibacter sp.]|uniref:oxidoreductase n=1 Tax=Pyruvatibacter sp. TaxID=1981328 RepID=UPI0032EE7F5D